MKAKTSLITIISSVALLSGSYSYAQATADNSTKPVSSVVQHQSNQAMPRLQHYRSIYQSLDLSTAQQQAIKKIKLDNMQANKAIIKQLQSIKQQLNKQMFVSNTDLSQVDKLIDQQSELVAKLEKTKFKTDYMIYTQILSDQQKQSLQQELTHHPKPPHAKPVKTS